MNLKRRTHQPLWRTSDSILTGFSYLWLIGVLGAGSSLLAGGGFALGVPPRLPRSQLSVSPGDAHSVSRSRLRLTGKEGNTGDFVVDISNRNATLRFWHEVYQASEGVEANWTGDVLGCQAGTVASSYLDATLRRVNYFRAMVGLRGVRFDAALNAQGQEAALMMSAANRLSHFPLRDDPHWPCGSAAGDEAAGKSNLSLGRAGAQAVEGQMEDAGRNNFRVGHRRWILFPPEQVMGAGNVVGGDGVRASNALWVVGSFGERPATPAFVSWPNQGYVPFPLVWERWSFSHPEADFSRTTVTMTREGQPIEVEVEHYDDERIGDPTLVFLPDPKALPKASPQQDIPFHVRLRDVRIGGGPMKDFSYDVIAFDPNRVNEPLLLSGPDSLIEGQGARYRFSAVEQADAYEYQVQRLENGPFIEDAEDRDASSITDGTSPVYPLIDSSASRSGARSFHLTYPEGFPRRFEGFRLNRLIVASRSGELVFRYRREIMAPTTTLRVETSNDGGSSWMQLDEEISGMGEVRDPMFLTLRIPLGGLEGVPIFIRFVLDHHFGSTFTGTGSRLGIHVDDIEVTGSMELVDTTVRETVAGALSFEFIPEMAASYWLRVRPKIGPVWLNFGEKKIVEVAERGGSSSSFITAVRSFAIDPTGFTVVLAAEGIDPARFTVETSLRLESPISWGVVKPIAAERVGPQSVKLRIPIRQDARQAFFRFRLAPE